jgi:TolA-binding protein
LPTSTLAQASGVGLSLVKIGVVAAVIAGAGATTFALHSTRYAPQTAAPTVALLPGFSARPYESSPPAEPVAPSADTSAAAPPAQVRAETRALRQEPTQPDTRVESAAAAAAESDAPAAARPPAQPLPQTAGSVPPNTKESASQLLRESALLEQGRRVLRAGDTAGAWRTLQQLAAEFPAGQLVQEREALAIELLWRSGRRSEASERIRAFVRAYPNSAHAARLRSLLAEPAP